MDKITQAQLNQKLKELGKANKVSIIKQKSAQEEWSRNYQTIGRQLLYSFAKPQKENPEESEIIKKLEGLIDILKARSTLLKKPPLSLMPCFFRILTLYSKAVVPAVVLCVYLLIKIEKSLFIGHIDIILETFTKDTPSSETVIIFLNFLYDLFCSNLENIHRDDEDAENLSQILFSKKFSGIVEKIDKNWAIYKNNLPQYTMLRICYLNNLRNKLKENQKQKYLLGDLFKTLKKDVQSNLGKFTGEEEMMYLNLLLNIWAPINPALYKQANQLPITLGTLKILYKLFYFHSNFELSKEMISKMAHHVIGEQQRPEVALKMVADIFRMSISCCQESVRLIAQQISKQYFWNIPMIDGKQVNKRKIPWIYLSTHSKDVSQLVAEIVSLGEGKIIKKNTGLFGKKSNFLSLMIGLDNLEMKMMKKLVESQQ